MTMSGWSSSSSGGHSQSGKLPHNVNTQSGLTEIYNQRVTKVEQVKRPMDSSGGSANIPFVDHYGVKVETETGKELLIHKGSGYGGSSGETVMADASHMSDK